MELLFVRHGETDKNMQSLTHERSDQTELNKTGRAQAQSVALVCHDYGIQAVYSSPEVRAQQTAEIIAQGLGLEVTIEQDLEERKWGDWAGLPWPEISPMLDPLSLDERYKLIPPNGESWQQMEHRLIAVISGIVEAGQNAIIVTHGGAMRSIMPILKNQPLATSLNYDFNNASITAFRYEQSKYIELFENDTSHLKSSS